MKAVINGKLVFPEEIREGTLLLEGETIREVRPAAAGTGAAQAAELPPGTEIIDAGGLYVGPGLIDEHVHGYSAYGEDFDIIRNVKSVAEAHLKHGTTTLIPSPSYSLRLGAYLEVIRQVKELLAEGGSSVAGVHLEGPYINPHMGAGRKYAWKYSDEIFEKLFAEAGGCVTHCTYAPEMPWAVQVEAMLKKYGVTMAVGHTQAGPEDIRRAVDAGARIVTHLFDGTGHWQGVHAFDFTGDPQDCVSDIVLSIPAFYYELICDSRYAHTTKTSQQLAWRVAGEKKIILISDCTCYNRRDFDPADFPPEDLRSATDLNINHEGSLFGSRLTVAQCAVNFRKSTGADIRQTFRCASTNAAEALGLDGTVGSVLPGRRADLVFADADFRIKRVLFRGEMLPEVRS